MKSLQLALCGFALLLLTACGSIDDGPLELSLELTEHAANSVENIQGQIILSNQGNSDLLVQRRLHTLPMAAPPGLSEVCIIITDFFGDPIYDQYYTANYSLPSEDTLSMMKPGEQIKKMIYLEHGFHTGMFNKGEIYYVVAVYQNDVEATQVIGGVNVPAWVGLIRSNVEMFFIKP